MAVENRIIKNQDEIYKKADEITNRILEILKEESINQPDVDDPSESIYLLIHIISLLCAKTSIGINGFGKIYGIKKLDTNTIFEWINNHAKNYIDNIEMEQKH